jgi:hypothetical protein
MSLRHLHAAQAGDPYVMLHGVAASNGSNWKSLGDTAQGSVRAGRIVAIIYAYNTAPGGDEGAAWEFWWLPIDDPEAGEVLGGRGGNPHEPPSRDDWAWAQQTTEWLYGEWLGERSGPASDT